MPKQLTIGAWYPTTGPLRRPFTSPPIDYSSICRAYDNICKTTYGKCLFNDTLTAFHKLPTLFQKFQFEHSGEIGYRSTSCIYSCRSRSGGSRRNMNTHPTYLSFLLYSYSSTLQEKFKSYFDARTLWLRTLPYPRLFRAPTIAYKIVVDASHNN
jgi:hypothetical protein